jgi:hypothetical protein
MKQTKPIGAETFQEWAAFFAGVKIEQARVEAERMVELGDMLRQITKHQTEH